MSQNTRNQQGDSQGNSGRESNDRQEQRSYEGFEGMNYEQRRQPYDPRHMNNIRRNDAYGDDDRRDEL